jgi:cellulose synthase operon protein YhjQ
MATEPSNVPEEQSVGETPEDVAILYSWANLHGAKYRDFSASRREYRAQVRHRAAEELRESELRAKAEAEAAALAADETTRVAEREAASRAELGSTSKERQAALRQAEDSARLAAAERLEAARRAEAAALAEVQSRREEREIAEAHASAQRQAARYADSDVRRRSLAGPQPARIVPGQMGDPYMHQGQPPVAPHNLHELYRTEDPNYRGYPEQDLLGEPQEAEPRRRMQGYRPNEASGVRYDHPLTGERGPMSPTSDGDRIRNFADDREFDPFLAGRQGSSSGQTRPSSSDNDGAGPAWLYSQSQHVVRPSPIVPPPAAPVVDTLQHSRERVASRWFALKGVFEKPIPEQPRQEAGSRDEDLRTSLLTVFSLAGGVGKTSLVATLGRSLSSLGERVLLADTTSEGLLPYYFGASELRAGVVRTFSPPAGSMDAPINLVSYDVDQRGHDRRAQEVFTEQLAQNSQAGQRFLFDIDGHNGWVIRHLARLNPIILVPLSPDMNSVIRLQSVDRHLQGITDAEGRPLHPYYLLNQFDASLPLHLDIREVLRRQLGDRLLPLVIRRSPAVSEALAEGMTVVDYSPQSSVAEDYLSVAKWLRAMSAPASSGLGTARWSQR